MDRWRRLPEAVQTSEEREKVSRLARVIFDERVKSQGGTNLDTTVRAEIERLRDSLR